MSIRNWFDDVLDDTSSLFQRSRDRIESFANRTWGLNENGFAAPEELTFLDNIRSWNNGRTTEDVARDVVDGKGLFSFALKDETPESVLENRRDLVRDRQFKEMIQTYMQDDKRQEFEDLWAQGISLSEEEREEVFGQELRDKLSGIRQFYDLIDSRNKQNVEERMGDRNLLDNIGIGFTEGLVLQPIQNLANIGDDIAPGIDPIADAMNYGSDIESEVLSENPELSSLARTGAQIAGSVAPIAVSFFIPGGQGAGAVGTVGLLGRVASLVKGGAPATKAVAAYQALQQVGNGRRMYQELAQDEGFETNAATETAVALGFGALGYVSEKLGIDALGAIGERAALGVAQRVGGELIERGLANVATRGAISALTMSGVEGTQETFEALAGNAILRAADPEGGVFDEGFMSYIQNVYQDTDIKETFMAGAAGGGMLSPFATTAAARRRIKASRVEGDANVEAPIQAPSTQEDIRASLEVISRARMAVGDKDTAGLLASNPKQALADLAVNTESETDAAYYAALATRIDDAAAPSSPDVEVSFTPRENAAPTPPTQASPRVENNQDNFLNKQWSQRYGSKEVDPNAAAPTADQHLALIVEQEAQKGNNERVQKLLVDPVAELQTMGQELNSETEAQYFDVLARKLGRDTKGENAPEVLSQQEIAEVEAAVKDGKPLKVKAFEDPLIARSKVAYAKSLGYTVSGTTQVQTQVDPSSQTSVNSRDNIGVVVPAEVTVGGKKTVESRVANYRVGDKVRLNVGMGRRVAAVQAIREDANGRPYIETDLDGKDKNLYLFEDAIDPKTKKFLGRDVFVQPLRPGDVGYKEGTDAPVNVDVPLPVDPTPETTIPTPTGDAPASPAATAAPTADAPTDAAPVTPGPVSADRLQIPAGGLRVRYQTAQGVESVGQFVGISEDTGQAFIIPEGGNIRTPVRLRDINPEDLVSITTPESQPQRQTTANTPVRPGSIVRVSTPEGEIDVPVKSVAYAQDGKTVVAAEVQKDDGTTQLYPINEIGYPNQDIDGEGREPRSSGEAAESIPVDGTTPDATATFSADKPQLVVHTANGPSDVGNWGIDGTYGNVLDADQQRTLNQTLSRFYGYPDGSGGVQGNVFFNASGVGVGKAQPLDSIVYTPNGPVKMGDIEVGDEVIGKNGFPVKVAGVYPQGSKSIYEVVFSDGVRVAACDEHLWFTQTGQDRKNYLRSGKSEWTGSVKSTAKIAETLSYRHGRNHSIPMVDPVHFNSRPLDIDPYVMGVILGDGHIRETGSTTITSADEEIFEFVSAALPETCYVSKSAVDKYAAGICGGKSPTSPNPFSAFVVNYGINGHRSWEKFIPEDFKYNSVANRIAVLQGLLDTDGTVGPRGTDVSFTSVSKVLSDDVVEIVQSLGGVARTRSRFTYCNGKKGRESYTVNINLPPYIQPFRLTRKAARVVPKSKYAPARYITDVIYRGEEAAQCIAVDSPDHLYVTDGFVVTHNTRGEILLALEIYNRQPEGEKKPVLIVTQNDDIAAQFRAEARLVAKGLFDQGKKELAIKVQNMEGIQLVKYTDFNTLAARGTEYDLQQKRIKDENKNGPLPDSRFGSTDAQIKKEKKKYETFKEKFINTSREGYITRGGYSNIYGTQYSGIVLDESQNIANPFSSRALSINGLIDTIVDSGGKAAYFTATPFESVRSSVDVVARLYGIDREAAAKVLGFPKEAGIPPKDGDKPIRPVDFNIKKIREAREKIEREGGMVSQSFPFWGNMLTTNTELTQDEYAEYVRIREYHLEGRPESALTENEFRQYYGDIKRFTELTKVRHVVSRIQEKLAENPNARIVVFAEQHVDPKIAGEEGYSKSFISQVEQQLTDLGISFVGFHGGVSKKQKGQNLLDFRDNSKGVSVAVATFDGAGTGVNLDDNNGNYPRTILFASIPESAVKIQQAMGRVSRKSTQSPSQVEFFVAPDSLSEEAKINLLKKKTRTLDASRSNQEGETVRQAILEGRGVGQTGRNTQTQPAATQEATTEAAPTVEATTETTAETTTDNDPPRRPNRAPRQAPPGRARRRMIPVQKTTEEQEAEVAPPVGKPVQAPEVVEEAKAPATLPVTEKESTEAATAVVETVLPVMDPADLLTVQNAEGEVEPAVLSKSVAERVSELLGNMADRIQNAARDLDAFLNDFVDQNDRDLTDMAEGFSEVSGAERVQLLTALVQDAATASKRGLEDLINNTLVKIADSNGYANTEQMVKVVRDLANSARNNGVKMGLTLSNKAVQNLVNNVASVARTGKMLSRSLSKGYNALVKKLAKITRMGLIMSAVGVGAIAGTAVAVKTGLADMAVNFTRRHYVSSLIADKNIQPLQVRAQDLSDGSRVYPLPTRFGTERNRVPNSPEGTYFTNYSINLSDPDNVPAFTLINERGDLTPITNTEGIVANFLNPFVSIAEIESDDQNVFVFNPANGRVQVGTAAEFRNSPGVMASPAPMIPLDFARNADGSYKLEYNGTGLRMSLVGVELDGTERVTPFGVTRDRNQNSVVGEEATTFGLLEGGKVIARAGDEVVILAGSAADIIAGVEALKANNPGELVQGYLLDNGSYLLPFLQSDGEISREDLEKHYRRNNSGGYAIALNRPPQPATLPEVGGEVEGSQALGTINSLTTEPSQEEIDSVKFMLQGYHGGKYPRMDRFNSAYMGTGEGAQAFGWGHYFTTSLAIAKNYAENALKRATYSMRLSPTRVISPGNSITLGRNNSVISYSINGVDKRVPLINGLFIENVATLRSNKTLVEIYKNREAFREVYEVMGLANEFDAALDMNILDLRTSFFENVFNLVTHADTLRSALSAARSIAETDDGVSLKNIRDFESALSTAEKLVEEATKITPEFQTLSLDGRVGKSLEMVSEEEFMTSILPSMSTAPLLRWSTDPWNRKEEKQSVYSSIERAAESLFDWGQTRGSRHLSLFNLAGNLGNTEVDYDAAYRAMEAAFLKIDVPSALEETSDQGESYKREALESASALAKAASNVSTTAGLIDPSTGVQYRRSVYTVKIAEGKDYLFVEWRDRPEGYAAEVFQDLLDSYPILTPTQAEGTLDFERTAPAYLKEGDWTMPLGPYFTAEKQSGRWFVNATSGFAGSMGLNLDTPDSVKVGYDSFEEVVASLNTAASLPTSYIYAHLSHTVGAKNASMLLFAGGISGIRFGAHGGRLLGQENFVVFADDDIEITNEENFQLVPRKLGVPKAEVQAAYEQLASRWDPARIPKIEILENESELPRAALIALERHRQRSNNPNIYPAGLEAGGTVYIVSENLDPEVSPMSVIAHEAIGHYGLRQAIGPALDAELEIVAQQYAQNAEFAQIAKRYGYDLTDTTQRLRAAEEFVAHAITKRYENGLPVPSVVQRVIDQIKQWWSGITGESIDDDKVADLIARSEAYMENGNTQSEAEFAGTDTPQAAQREWAEKGLASRFFKNFFGDWQNPEIDENGRNLSSQVVDEFGVPMRMYHGTLSDFAVDSNGIIQFAKRDFGFHFGNIEAATDRMIALIDEGNDEVGININSIEDLRLAQTFEPDPTVKEALDRYVGAFDTALMNGANPEQAQAEGINALRSEGILNAFVKAEYGAVFPIGANIMPTYLSIKNPFRIKDVGNFTEGAIIDEIQKAAAEGRISQEAADRIKYSVEVDRSSLRDSVRDQDTGQYRDEFGELFPSSYKAEADARRLLLIEALEAEGIDGFVYENNTEARGHDSYMPFRRNQIKSATGNNGEFSRLHNDIRFLVRDNQIDREVEIGDALQQATAALPESDVVKVRTMVKTKGLDATLKALGSMNLSNDLDAERFAIAYDKALEADKVEFDDQDPMFMLVSGPKSAPLPTTKRKRAAKVRAAMREHRIPGNSLRRNVFTSVTRRLNLEAKDIQNLSPQAADALRYFAGLMGNPADLRTTTDSFDNNYRRKVLAFNRQKINVLKTVKETLLANGYSRIAVGNRPGVGDGYRDVINMVRNGTWKTPVTATEKALAPAAKSLHDMFQNLLDYQVDAGMLRSSQGLVNYFTRSYNRAKMVENEVAFKQLVADRLTTATGGRIDATDAGMYAEMIFRKIVHGGDMALDISVDPDNHTIQVDRGFNDLVGRITKVMRGANVATPGTMKSRMLTFVSDADLDAIGVLDNNLPEVLTGYVNNTVRKTEFAKKFGTNFEVLEDVVRVIANSDLHTDKKAFLIKRLKTSVMAVTGTLDMDWYGGWMERSSAETVAKSGVVARNMVSWSALALSGLAGAIETGTPLLLYGRDALPAYHQAMYTLIKRAFGKNQGEIARYVDDMNLATDLASTASSLHIGSENTGGAWMGSANAYYHRYISLLEPIMATQRHIATAAMRNRMERIFLKDFDSVRGEDKRFLDKYEIATPGDFAQVKGIFASFRNNVQLTDAQFDRLSSIMYQGVTDTIVEATAVNKPAWGSSQAPYYQMIYQLQSFSDALRNGPVAIYVDELKHGNLWVLLRMLPMVFIAAAVEAARDAMNYAMADVEDKKTMEYFASQEDRSLAGRLTDPATYLATGLQGNIDRAIRPIVSMEKYNRDPLEAFGGIAVGRASTVVKGLYEGVDTGDWDKFAASIGAAFPKMAPIPLSGRLQAEVIESGVENALESVDSRYVANRTYEQKRNIFGNN